MNEIRNHTEPQSAARRAGDRQRGNRFAILMWAAFVAMGVAYAVASYAHHTVIPTHGAPVAVHALATGG